MHGGTSRPEDGRRWEDDRRPPDRPRARCSAHALNRRDDVFASGGRAEPELGPGATKSTRQALHVLTVPSPRGAAQPIFRATLETLRTAGFGGTRQPTTSRGRDIVSGGVRDESAAML